VSLVVVSSLLLSLLTVKLRFLQPFEKHCSDTTCNRFELLWKERKMEFISLNESWCVFPLILGLQIKVVEIGIKIKGKMENIIERTMWIDEP
jgi:hypothetical protein